MISIHYIRWGKKDKDCKFLETTPQQRNELYKMVNDCKEFDNDIEVNIVKSGLIKK